MREYRDDRSRSHSQTKVPTTIFFLEGISRSQSVNLDRIILSILDILINKKINLLTLKKMDISIVFYDEIRGLRSVNI